MARLASWLGVFVVGCGLLDREVDTELPDLDDEEVVGECTTEELTAVGGLLSTEGLSIQVPAGAFVGTTQLTACSTADASLASPRWTITVDPPESLWTLPLSVSLTHTGNDTTELFKAYPDSDVLRAWNTEKPTPNALRGTIEVPGPVYAAEDERVVEPYGASSQIDLLVVMDTSCSMAPDQQRFGDTVLEDLRTELFDRELDFHYGVVTTNLQLDRGQLQPGATRLWLTPESENFLSQMFSMTVVGVPPAPAPQEGRRAVDAAYELREGFNQGFFREKADTHVVFFSDDVDETSTPTEDEFLSWFDTTFDAGSACHALAATAGMGGDLYGKLATETGGVSWDIDTDDDWADFFVEVLDVAEGGLLQPLSGPAVPDSIEVWRVPEDAPAVRLDPATVDYDDTTGLVTVSGLEDLSDLFVLYASAQR